MKRTIMGHDDTAVYAVNKGLNVRTNSLSAIAIAALLVAVEVAHATTYTYTQTAAGTYDWTASGNWDGNGVPVGAIDAGITIFSNTTTVLTNGTYTLNNDPATLTLNALTINGKGPSSGNAANVYIGTAGNTWTFDGTTPTITLNGMDGSSKALVPRVSPNIVLNTNLVITGNGTAATVQQWMLTGFDFLGGISGGYGITKNGACTIKLTGNNSYTGGTVLNAGTVYIGNANAFGTGTLTFAGNSKLIPQYGGNYTLTNSVIVNTNVIAEVNVINQFYKLTLSSPFEGTGTLYVNDSDSSAGGILTLSHTNNTFTGTVQIGNGSIGQLNVNSLPDSANPIQFRSDFVNNSGGRLDLHTGAVAPLVFNSRQIWLSSTANKNISAIINNNNGTAANTITINTDLAVTGTVSTATRSLTLGGSNTGTNAFNGKIANGPGSGALSLTKADAGKWILRGTNTYTGSTTISGGTLEIAGSGYLGGGSYAGAIANSGTLLFSSSATQTLSGIISGTGGALVKSGTGTLTLSATNSYTGATRIIGGTLVGVTGGYCSKSIVAVTNAPGDTAALAINVTDASKPWSCASLAFTNNSNGCQLKFAFADANPSESTAPLYVTNSVTFSGDAPLVVVDSTNLKAGKTYPLLTAGISAPTTVPPLSITGANLGKLSWGATDKTLYLTVAPAGTVIYFF